MATRQDAAQRFRCLSCGAVDAPVIVHVGPGWIALALWVLTAGAWGVSWWWPMFSIGFWALLFVTLLYTIWYFYKKERACRSCGSRTLDADGAL